MYKSLKQFNPTHSTAAFCFEGLFMAFSSRSESSAREDDDDPSDSDSDSSSSPFSVSYFFGDYF